MIALRMRGVVSVGVGLTAFYTFLITCADAITKMFAASYAAPQLFVLSGLIVAGLSRAQCTQNAPKRWPFG